MQNNASSGRSQIGLILKVFAFLGGLAFVIYAVLAMAAEKPVESALNQAWAVRSLAGAITCFWMGEVTQLLTSILATLRGGSSAAGVVRPREVQGKNLSREGDVPSYKL